MPRRTIAILIPLILGFACQTLAAPPTQDAVDSIVAADLERRLAVLADDAMKGRDLSNGGLDRAADALIATMTRIGLEPAGLDDTYEQPFTHTLGRQTLKLRNILGRVPGTDPDSDAVVVLSAHYDHIGIAPDRGQADRIYNGADDNASGVSMILELAEALVKSPPKHDVIVVAFTAEEIGLIGSRHFAENPTIPLDRVIAAFNFEMVGRPAPVGAGSFWITGFDRSTLGPILRDAAAELGVRATPDPFPGQNFFRRSDNFPLAQKGVIAHTCCSFDPAKHRDYHQVSDEIGTIDFDHMQAVARAIYQAVYLVADGQVTPAWDPDDPLNPNK